MTSFRLQTIFSSLVRGLFCGWLVLLTLTSFAFAAVPAIPFTVTMSEAVNVTGSPRIVLNVDGNTRYAVYSAGTGTASLTFTYTATAGDVDLNGIGISSTSVDLNGGTVTDLNGNPLTNLTFTAPANMGSVNVNYPSLAMDFIYDADGRYSLNGTVYNDLTSFLTAASGSFTRASTATYFDSSGNLQTAAINTPRFDYGFGGASLQGLLMEETRTNSTTNSQAAGSTAGTIGSGGVLPTTWGSQLAVAGGTGTVSATILGTGTVNGMNYIDVRYFGSVTSGTGIADIVFGSAITGSATQVWTFSTYAAMIGGSLTNVNTSCPKLKYSNSGGSYIGESASCTATSSSTLTRVKQTATLPASTASFSFRYALYISPGAFDVTFRYAAPQAELGAFPTSYIPTTTTAVTRSADILNIAGLNTASPMTWIGSWNLPYIAGNGIQRVLSSQNAVGGCCRRLRLGSTNTAFQYEDSVPVLVANLGTGVQTPAGAGKMAARVTTDNFAFSVNGALTGTDTLGTVSNVTSLYVGQGGGGTESLNGHVRRVALYPSAASNSQLLLLSQ